MWLKGVWCTSKSEYLRCHLFIFTIYDFYQKYLSGNKEIDKNDNGDTANNNNDANNNNNMILMIMIIIMITIIIIMIVLIILKMIK